MHPPIDLPELALVRALTSGGPYADGDTISVAFTTPKVGRLVAHAAPGASDDSPPEGHALLPETISAVVVRGAGPYMSGDVLTLSFVDPGVARIHPATNGSVATRAVDRDVAASLPASAHAGLETTATTTSIVSEGNEITRDVALHFSASPPVEPSSTEKPASPPSKLRGNKPRATGVRLSLSWNPERVRRFVQVADKLFTVDRLGWYRHAFAMRLLVPDTITCGAPDADAAASLHLRALRSAALETLGRPLIAAFMPTFAVTPEWLDTIDSAEAARALSGLRAAIAPHVSDEPRVAPGDDPASTYGVVRESELRASPATSVEALLPLLVANVSVYDDVTERLTSYRQALSELFGATAQSAETVRLGQMAQPNHTLDDRLWQLVGAVGERFGGLAAV